MNSEVSNPFSTGGGGTTFEQLVGMYYLVSVLAADIPRGLNDGICYRVAFQQRWNNAILDDIVVTARSSNASESTLMLQVKHTITISAAESNGLFQRVISDCWKVFKGQRGSFNPDIDRLGVAVGIYHSNIDEHLQRLLQWARTSASVEEFGRVRVANFASREMRKYFDDFEVVLSKVAGEKISEEDLWHFLKCFVYIHFDIENDGSRDLSYLKNRVLDQLVNRDSGEAHKLIDYLRILVSDYSKTGGAIDGTRLRQHLNHYGLKDQVDCTRDLEQLRKHSNRTLSRINEKIGQRIHLPRTNLVSETIDAIRENPIVFILGEPGAGKSVLLKKMVDHFRQEGEVLVTSTDNLSGTTLEEFSSNLKIDHDFQQLLSAFRAAPFRCLFIDNLGQALSDDQSSNVLYDLIHEIRTYNDKILDVSVRWRIVVTCRSDQFHSLLPSLQIVIDLSTLATLTVPPLESSDIDSIVEVFPSFQHLSKQSHIQNLLRNPFVLDFLTSPELKHSNLSKPEILTESWLIELYWMRIIRNSERTRRVIEKPDVREHAIVLLGELRLKNGRKHVPTLQLNPEVIGSLAQDRVIHSRDGRISFVHDILDDWTVSRILLSHWDQLPVLLREYEETMQLIKPISLLALRHLELEQAADQWIELLNILRSDRQLAARWYQTVLVAPLSSPMLDTILATIEPILFTDDGLLLTDFIRALRTVYTVPSQLVLKVLQGNTAPQSELEKILARYREPIIKHWMPVWELLFKHQRNLPVKSLPEIAAAANMWMEHANAPLRKEVALFCLDLLNNDFQTKLRNEYYTDEYITYSSQEGWIDDQVVRKLRAAVFHGADCIPQEIKTLLYSLVQVEERQLVELLFGRDANLSWIPIAQYMPEVFVEITLQIFCDTCEIKTDEAGDKLSRRLLSQLGIKHDHIWSFSEDYKDTPFYHFLNINPTYGVKLVVELVNFATQKWVEIVRRIDKVHPLPQILTLSRGKREFWGDHEVYNWCLELNVRTVHLALTSLRYWLDEYLKTRADEDPSKVFNIILSKSNSFALVSVCILVAHKDIKKRTTALLPILEQPAFWEIDSVRLTHMMAFGKGDTLYQFASLAQYILFTGEPEDRERIQSALTRFPSNLPFFFEEEKKNIELVTSRQKHMEQIASFGNLENYSLKEYESNFIIEFKFPPEIEQQRQQETEEIEDYLLQTNLQNWAYSVASGKQPTTLSLDQAIELGKHLETVDEAYNGRINSIIAETCAASVIKHYGWLKENGHLEWCRQKLFEAIRHKDTQSGIPDPITGLFHVVAKSLPSLVINDLSDNEAREVIWDLIVSSNPHQSDVAVKSLFEAIIPLWQIDADYVWQCFNLLVIKAKVILSHRNKAYREAYDEIVFDDQIELRAEVPELGQLDINCVYLLTPLITAFPRMSDLLSTEVHPQYLKFINEIVELNNKANKYSQMTYESGHHPFQVPHEWEKPLYDLLANWMLFLPFDQACKHILDPVIDVWEGGPGALENLLNGILMNSESSGFEKRVVEIWRHTIPRIMQTETVLRNPQGGRNTEFKHTYSCLILMTRYGIIEVWKDRDWNPSLKLVQEFSLWVEKLGHYHDHFSTFVRMLRTVGKPIQVPYGINWLYEVFQRAEKVDRLFSDSQDFSALSRLLLDMWFDRSSLIQDQPLFQKFTFLVDYLSSKGDQIAVELQRKIQY